MGAVGKVLVAVGTAAAIAALSAPVRAQAGPADEGARGFGERGSLLFSVENVFGVLDQTYTQGPPPNSPPNTNGTSQSLNGNGFFPQGFVGTRLGVNGLLSSGITLGGIVGVWNETATSQNGGSFTAFNIGPRIGWAGCLRKYKAIGFWGRVGPTFQYVNFSQTVNVAPTPQTFSIDAWALDLSFEAFIVWSPVDHFGLLAGPSVDLGLVGHESASNGGQSQGTDFGYHSVGMSFGLVFEL
jgi:hypothetical protein